MKPTTAARPATADAPASFQGSELAFAPARQSQAGLLATLPLHELVLAILLPFAPAAARATAPAARNRLPLAAKGSGIVLPAPDTPRTPGTTWG